MNALVWLKINALPTVNGMLLLFLLFVHLLVKPMVIKLVLYSLLHLLVLLKSNAKMPLLLFNVMLMPLTVLLTMLIRLSVTLLPLPLPKLTVSGLMLSLLLAPTNILLLALVSMLKPLVLETPTASGLKLHV